jgi:hypothetical protein
VKDKIIEPETGKDKALLAPVWTVRGSSPGGGEIFRAVQIGLEAYPASCTMSIGSLLGVKRPERNSDHPLPCRAEIANGLDLYLNIPSVPA